MRNNIKDINNKIEKFNILLFPLIKFMMQNISIPREKNKIGSFNIPEFQKRIEGVKKITHFKTFSLSGKKVTIALNNANSPIKLSMQKNNI